MKRNPAYEEIKASIRERGLDAAPANGHLDPGPGRIAHTDVVSLPTRAPTSTDPAEHVHQYDATYRLVIAD